MKIQKVLFVVSLLAVAVGIAAPAVRAQVAEKKTLTLDGAERIIAVAKSKAKELNAPGGVIAVVDAGGNLVALAPRQGASV
jgi:hypothetical protein